MKKEVIMVVVIVVLAAVVFVIGVATNPTGRTSTIETDTYTCHDTDGGINLAEKGTATRTNDRTGNSVEFTDYCRDPDQLKEYYCYGNRVRSQTRDYCDCVDGACPDEK